MLIAMVLQMVVKFGELEVVHLMHRQMTSWPLKKFNIHGKFVNFLDVQYATVPGYHMCPNNNALMALPQYQ